MGQQITDEMLDAFTVTGTYDDIVDGIKATYGIYATSIGFSIPVRAPEDEERLKAMLRDLQAV